MAVGDPKDKSDFIVRVHQSGVHIQSGPPSLIRPHISTLPNLFRPPEGDDGLPLRPIGKNPHLVRVVNWLVVNRLVVQQ